MYVEGGYFLDEFVALQCAGKTLLDLGAGTGRLLPLCAGHGVKATVIDWSDAF
jgi:cyclopropane fatty-acyl-phospholipid synthase-like methyltransferase